MATPLTWRNVGSTASAAAGASLAQSATETFNTGLTGLNSLVKDQQQLTEKNDTAMRSKQTEDFLTAMAGFSTPEQLQEAQANGGVQSLMDQYQYADQKTVRETPQNMLEKLRTNALSANKYEDQVRGIEEEDEVDTVTNLIADKNWKGARDFVKAFDFRDNAGQMERIQEAEDAALRKKNEGILFGEQRINNANALEDRNRRLILEDLRPQEDIERASFNGRAADFTTEIQSAQKSLDALPRSARTDLAPMTQEEAIKNITDSGIVDRDYGTPNDIQWGWNETLNDATKAIKSALSGEPATGGTGQGGKSKGKPALFTEAERAQLSKLNISPVSLAYDAMMRSVISQTEDGKKVFDFDDARRNLSGVLADLARNKDFTQASVYSNTVSTRTKELNAIETNYANRIRELRENALFNRKPK